MCVTDRAIGSLLMTLGGFVLLLLFHGGMLLTNIEGLVWLQFGDLFSRPGLPIMSPNGAPVSQGDPVHDLTVLLVFVVGALLVACGIGMFQSSRSWFFTSIVFLGLMSLSGIGPALFCLFVVGYCVLRLNKVIGSWPESEDAPTNPAS